MLAIYGQNEMPRDCDLVLHFLDSAALPQEEDVNVTSPKEAIQYALDDLKWYKVLFIASDKSTQSEQDVRGQEDQEAADQEF
jgi:hypothetical protein